MTIGNSDSNGNAGTEIDYNAFSDCTSLKTLTIGNSVTKIGVCAFSGCTALTNVNISDSVTEIESGAFIGCSSLAIVTIGNSVSNIGGGAFAYCSSLAEISVAQDNPYYSSMDGVLFNKDCSELIAYPNAKGSEYIIPDSVISIGHQAFLACYSLAYVTIPNSITEIGEEAFWECNSLISVTIPDSVTKFQRGILFGCKSLTALTIPGHITEIGELAIAQCENLTHVYYNCKEPVEIDDLSIFVDSLEKASLYVPEHAVEKCQIISPWKYFKNIEAYDFSGVETVSGDAEKIVTGRYDVSGSSVDEEYKGLVIVRYSDGSTQKKLQK